MSDGSTDNQNQTTADLQSGYTTGTCAAAAARAAMMVLTGQGPPDEVFITLPDGEVARLPVEMAEREDYRARAAVRKDAGDDPDVTDGALIVVEAAWGDNKDGNEGQIQLRAGEGVGIVTRPGLQVEPGEPAINPVPRRMIRSAVRDITQRPVTMTILVPGGEEIAEETFNPRLGIRGGISILGTSGRVRPFSCPALRESLSCSIDIAVAAGVTCPILVPGHVGERAARKHLTDRDERIIPVSNEWGYMLDEIGNRDFERFIAVGHPGKMAKLAAGHWDTHSSRSPSAVPIVLGIARNNHVPAQEHETTEGVFSELGARERRRLGDALAEVVQRAVDNRTGNAMNPAVLLVDMEANMLGKAPI
ncbi:MAG: cobalt-precorrin-5B (C(1))-methyltransferase CbiD [Planctomycetota bacterium]